MKERCIHCGGDNPDKESFCQQCGVQLISKSVLSPELAETLINALRRHRKHFLSLASADVKRWCCPPNQRVEGNRLSDQHWLRKFREENIEDITAEDAKAFLNTFGLSRPRLDSDRVASAIRELVGMQDFSVPEGVVSLSRSPLAANGGRPQLSSAASKICCFARPASRVYIWDSLATKSARLRDAARRGTPLGTVKLSLYRLNGRHDYAAFHAACAYTHAEEMKYEDFNRAVGELDRYFMEQGGEISDRARVPIDFIERRLLDKLMFWEGWAIGRGILPQLPF